MNRLLPEGRLIKVEFVMRLPEFADMDDIEDWVGLFLGCRGHSMSSPLAKYEPEPFDDFTLTDSHQIGTERREVISRSEDGKSTRYRVWHEIQPSP